MTVTAAWRRPAWAEDRTEEEGGIRWHLTRQVEALPSFVDGPASTVTIEAFQYDRVVVDDADVRLERGPIEMLVGDELMTLDQAVDFAGAILTVAKMAGADA